MCLILGVSTSRGCVTMIMTVVKRTDRTKPIAVSCNFTIFVLLKSPWLLIDKVSALSSSSFTSHAKF